MTSVINSARTSTASVFDFVGSTANVANQLVATAAKSVDMLDAKASLMHTRVIANCRFQSVVAVDDELTKAATDHTDIMEEIHRRNSPGTTFDRAAHFTTIIAKMQASLESN